MSVGIRVGVIGAGGTVGSAAAFRIAELGIASEIILVDSKKNMAASHAMDMEQGISELSNTFIRAGGWADMGGCRIILMCASLPERNVSSRNEYLAGNIEIVRETAANLRRYCPEAVVINATNPVDVLNYVLFRSSGLEARQFIGYSWNDTLRFRWAIAKTLGVRVAEVGALVLGEHGDHQVPLFDRITVQSQAVRLTGEQEDSVRDAIRTWFGRYHSLQSGRTTGWTSAVGIAKLVHAVATESDEVLPCSVVLEGGYGFSGLSLSVPVRLGAGGVSQIVELPLTELQKELLANAASSIKSIIEIGDQKN